MNRAGSKFMKWSILISCFGPFGVFNNMLKWFHEVCREKYGLLLEEIMKFLCQDKTSESGFA